MADLPECSPKRATLRALETSDAFFEENERQVALSLLAFLRDPFGGEARESLNRIEASRRPRGRLRPVR
jgi:hypothetical protein